MRFVYKFLSSSYNPNLSNIIVLFLSSTGITGRNVVLNPSRVSNLFKQNHSGLNDNNTEKTQKFQEAETRMD